jgi:hypothetical protein
MPLNLGGHTRRHDAQSNLPLLRQTFPHLPDARRTSSVRWLPWPIDRGVIARLRGTVVSYG